MRDMARRTKHTATAADLGFAEYDAQLAALDAEVARIEGKLPALAAALTDRQAAADAAEALAAELAYRRDVGDQPGLDDGIEAADADADRARRAFRRAEHNQRQAHVELTCLRTERERVARDRGRAQVAALSPAAVAAVAAMGAKLREFVNANRRLRAVRLEQVQLAVNAGLPDAEIGRLHDFRSLIRKVRWELGNAGFVNRPLSGRYLADVAFEDVERLIQHGEPTPDAPDTDNSTTDDVAA